MSDFFRADQLPHRKTISDNIDPSWCPNTGEYAVHIEFPTPTGKKLIVTETVRKCLSAPNYHCPKDQFSNPLAFNRCSENQLPGEK